MLLRALFGILLLGSLGACSTVPENNCTCPPSTPPKGAEPFAPPGCCAPMSHTLGAGSR